MQKPVKSLGCAPQSRGKMRLLFSGEWFEPITSESQYESDFESVIMSRAESLFPRYYVVPFRTPVESEEGRKVPDMALLDRNYRFWWVVEVEMAHHSLYGHVIPQVEVFARGKYGAEHADYLAKSRFGLDRVRLRDMIKGAQPRVLVLVNRNVPSWIEPIHRLDGLVTVVETFRSGRNQHILRVNGDYPEAEEGNIASLCRLDNTLPNLLQVDSPASLGAAPGEEVAMEFNGGLTIWSRVDTSDHVWLVPTGRNPLVVNQEYLILKDSENRLSLRVRT